LVKGLRDCVDNTMIRADCTKAPHGCCHFRSTMTLTDFVTLGRPPGFTKNDFMLILITRDQEPALAHIALRDIR